MKPLTRRDFVKRSMLLAAAGGLWPMMSGCQSARVSRVAPTRIRGANEDIRVAVVGVGGRGRDAIANFSKLKGARLVALCDVDSAILERELKRLRDQGMSVEGFTDYRRLLENPDIDAVSLATPNHWHALGTIWAVQAGKDVYVEKPISHNVWEGRKAVEAARKYRRIVQGGTQSRSSSGIFGALTWLWAGNLGQIQIVRGFCYKRRASIGKTVGPQPIPATVDYDQWLGPAPFEPLRRARLHYDWHWVWSTGNGDLGNQGVHQMDIARWALRANQLSPRVLSIGGRLGYVDDGETPNTQLVWHEYPTAPLLFEVRGLATHAGAEKMDTYQGIQVGVLVECEGGTLEIPNYHSATARDRNGRVIQKFSGAENHYANFLEAVRSRRFSDLTADILEGHLSAALCHTGNISYRLGQVRPPEQIRAAVRDIPYLAEAFQRMEQHIAANQVDLSVTPLILGETLTMFPATEVFANNPQANRLLTRKYRKPYVVPNRV